MPVNSARAFVILILATLFPSLTSAAPFWWSVGQISDASGSKDAVTIGQVKYMASTAWAHLDSALKAKGYATGADFTVNYTSSPYDDQAAVIGHLRAAAKPFYDRLAAVGYTGPPQLIGGIYPWSAASAETTNVATVAQLKYIFSFEVLSSNAPDGPDFPPLGPVGINNGEEAIVTPNKTDQIASISYSTQRPCTVQLSTVDPETGVASDPVQLLDLDGGASGNLQFALPLGRHSTLTIHDAYDSQVDPTPVGDNLQIGVEYESPDSNVDTSEMNLGFLAFENDPSIATLNDPSPATSKSSVGGRDFNIKVATVSHTPTIHLLPIDVVRVNADGSPAKHPEMLEPSHPSPVISVSNFNLLSVSRDTDGNLVGLLDVAGTITSEVCDTLPGTEGEIATLSLKVNSQEILVNSAPAISVSTQSKPALESPSTVFGKPYPYVGSFSTSLSINLSQGLNVVEISGSDKIFGIDGYVTYGLNVNVSEDENGDESITFKESPEPIAQSGGGEFYPFVVRVRGPIGLESLLGAEIVADDGSAGLVSSLMPVSDGPGPHGTYYMRNVGAFQNDPNSTVDAPLIAALRQRTADDDEIISNASLAAKLRASAVAGVSDGLQYMIGFNQGFLKQGADVVTGFGSAAWQSSLFISGQTWVKFGLSVKLLFIDEEGSDAYEQTGYALNILDDEQQRAKASLSKFKAVLDDFSNNKSDVAELALAMLTNDVETLHSNQFGLSDHHRQLFIDGAEVLAAGLKSLTTGDSFDLGVAHGRLFFEVAATIIPAGHLTKADKLQSLLSRKAFQTGGQYEHLVPDISALHSALLATKMCFVAGTMVRCQLDGIETQLPIESVGPLIKAGAEIKIWSQDEFIRSTGWKRPLSWTITSPVVLCNLAYDVNGDGVSDETLTGTLEHPFWIEEKNSFVPMGELEPGDQLTLIEDGYAVVTGSSLQHASEGQTFTTFNFEVAGFHTYFVGEAGVWVHNNSDVPCQWLYSLYNRFRSISNKTPQEAWEGIESKYVFGPKKGTFSNVALGNALEDVLRNDVFMDSNIQLWTKGSMESSGHNLFEHWIKHGREFPDVTNGVNYVIKAREFVDNFPSGPDFHAWEHPSQAIKFFVNKATREKAIQVTAGSEAGALKTFHKHDLTRDLEAWARSNGFTGSW